MPLRELNWNNAQYFEPPVSIILIAFNSNKKIVEKIKEKISQQEYLGNIELIIQDKPHPLAKNMNDGIKKAKNEFVITLHGDCIPVGKYWLKEIMAPFKDKSTVATCSKVRFPMSVWSNLGILTQALFAPEKGTIQPFLDEKGCAYRKKILSKIGFFNEKKFRVAGEDYDLAIRIVREGKVVHPGCIVDHYHPMTFKRKIKKIYEYSNGYGALVKIHGRKFKGGYKGLIKSFPILSYPLFIATYPIKKVPERFIPFSLLMIPLHLVYTYGFWKGFINGEQTV